MTDRALEIFRARVELAERGQGYARDVLAAYVRGRGGWWR